LGYVLLKVKESRRRKLLQELRDVLKARKLSPSHAARLRGKLYFTTTSAFFGVGRPALRSFTERQYSKRQSHALDSGLTNAIEFFIALLQGGLPPHEYYLKPATTPTLYVWSDAMWETCRDESGAAVVALDEESGAEFYIAHACIAFIVYDPIDFSWHWSRATIGIDVLRLMVPGKKTYIGQLEALAAACVLETLPTERMRGRPTMFWIDNLSAKYGLQKGYSKVDDSGRIINAFKVRQAFLRMRVWFEYVPSAQNIADLPSRGALDQMFYVIDTICAHVDWDVFEHAMCFPRFETWCAPIEGAASSSKHRSGSRGARRAKRPKV
jgi:hypothetical protein